MSKDISFTRLRVFCEVVDSKGFRAASERLNISQPAISGHIRALEEDLQTQLLTRDRFIHVTEAGAIFYNFAKQTLNNLEEISFKIAELRSANAGKIAIAAEMMISRYVMPQVLSDFKRINPGIEINSRLGNQKQISDMTLRKEVDFGFILGHVSLAGMISEPVAKEEIVFVTGPNHALAKKEIVFPAELSSHQFVLPAPIVTSRAVVERTLNFHQVKINEILMELEDTELIKKIVSTGNGISILLRASAADEIRSGKLKILKLASGSYYEKISIVRRADQSFSPIQNKFIEFCMQRIRSQFAETAMP